MTDSTIRFLADKKLRNKVALIGFDELAYADLLSPSVSVVVQDIEGIARQAAEIVFERMSGQKNSAAREVRLPTRYIQRESGLIRVSSK